MTRSRRIYHKWTFSLRETLQSLRDEGYSGRKIGHFMDIPHTTVKRELQRCPPGKYKAKEAQIDAEEKKQRKADNNREYRVVVMAKIGELEKRIEQLERRNPS